MPDFDTRRPQEPEQPSNIHMTRLLGIRVSILLPTVLAIVLAVVIIVWFVLSSADRFAGTPADDLLGTRLAAYQLDQEIQLEPTPAFELAAQSSNSSAFSCEPEVEGYDTSFCWMIATEATGARQLASITEDMIDNPSDTGSVLKISFIKQREYELGGTRDIATLYCFKRKSVAISALGDALNDAELLGKTDSCYLALYKEDQAEMLLYNHPD